MPKTKLSTFRTQRQNANAHTPRGLGMLANSIGKDGWIGGLTVAADGETFDGSARLETLADLMPDAEPIVVHTDGQRPVVVVRDDIPSADDPRAKRLGIAANRVQQVDYAPDAAVLAQLASEIDLTQFWSKEELADILGAAGNDAEDPGADVDRAAELQEKWSTSVGQLWQVGRHQLLVGDCTVRANVERLMGGERAACMWTDPPYGVDYVGKTKDALTIENDGAADLPGLLTAAFMTATEILEPGAPFYVAHPAGARHLVFWTVIDAIGWQIHQELIWVKDSMVLGHSDYHYKHEPILYGFTPGPGRSGRGKHEGTRWRGDHAQVSVFDIPRPKRNEEHPTMKPPELVEAMLKNSTRQGDMVYDGFTGSGTTLVACERLGRIGRGIELSPGYAAVSIQRLSEMGLTAELLD